MARSPQKPPRKLIAVGQPGSEDEPAPECSAVAVDLLDQLLASQDFGDELLFDWLRRLGRRDERVPSTHLPELLSRATEDPRLRPLVLEIGGHSLSALVTGVDELAWAVPGPELSGDVSEVWRTVSGATREALLQRVRASDAAAGRALIENSWEEASAEQRQELLEGLYEGLELGDQDLLERALDDEDALVREIAAQLLAELPGSLYQSRMAERLRPLIAVEHGRLRVELPGQPNPAALRDLPWEEGYVGLEPAESFLARIIAAAPLGEWSSLGPDIHGPVQWLELAQEHDHEDGLLLGWRDAAIAQQDKEWQLAVFARFSDPALLIGLEPSVAEPAVMDVLAGTSGDSATNLLINLAGPWGPALSAAALDLVTGDPRPSSTLHSLIGQRIDPTLFDHGRATARAAISLPAGDHPTFEITLRRAGAQALLRMIDLREAISTQMRTR
jgi:hypothetical protein